MDTVTDSVQSLNDQVSGLISGIGHATYAVMKAPIMMTVKAGEHGEQGESGGEHGESGGEGGESTKEGSEAGNESSDAGSE